MASKLKLLKEEEKLLLSIENKLTSHLEELRKEEVYLQALLSQADVQEEGDEDEETIDIKVSLDDKAMNQAPLDDLNQASTSFFQMYQGVDDGEEEYDEDDENVNAAYTGKDVSKNLVNIIKQMQQDEIS